MRVLVGALVAAAVIAALLTAALQRGVLFLGPRRVDPPQEAAGREVRVADLRYEHDHDVLPRYVDLDVGDTLRVVRRSLPPLDMVISSIEIESHQARCPRTRVDLESGGRKYQARCGMLDGSSGGIPPITIDGVRLAVEVTRLLFSRFPRGDSPFNSYPSLRLGGEVRFAVWDSTLGVTRGERGTFVLDQPQWTRGRFGNWLHGTRYGIHSAIDVFATAPGNPEPVLCPVDGTVYKTYNRDADPDDRSRSKVVNIWGDRVVGPGGERVLYRFQHLSEIAVQDGQVVRSGQMIGRSGHSGFDPSIGDHLHFEIRLNPSCFGLDRDDDLFATIPVNPYNYLLEWHQSRVPAEARP